MAASLHLLVCQYYIREVEAIVREEGFEDVSVSAYPDVCVHPQTERLREAERLFDDAGRQDRTTLLVGACFMMRPGKQGFVEDRLHKVHRVELCFHLLLNRRLVEWYVSQGAYLVTPGWLEAWDRHLAEWQFDQATARAFFAETTRQLVLLDTGVDSDAGARLTACADYLSLPCSVIPVGLDHLRLVIAGIVQQWRRDEMRQTVAAVTGQAHRKLADYMLAFDLLVKLARIMDEPAAIRVIIDLFGMLFGAGEVTYVTVADGEPGQVHSTRPRSSDDRPASVWVTRLKDGQDYTVTDTGFCLRIKYQESTVGVLCADAMAFPQHEQDYLNLALGIVHLCGLAIANARAMAERDLAAAELRNTSTELARSNAELEQFAYVVSHDLQAPLRRIKAFGELLAEDAGDGLNATARDHLARMQRSADHMQQLIEGLLSYARVSTRGRALSPVRLGPVVQRALEDLAPRLHETGGRVEVGPLPVVRGDELQLYQVFLNLIGNALKFVAPGRAPTVRITARRVDEREEIRVEDNGIGFSDADAGQLFKPFQRLHSESEYPGSGIGLALCQKIALRHGGVIAAHGTPGQGATFIVSLPAMPEVADAPVGSDRSGDRDQSISV